MQTDEKSHRSRTTNNLNINKSVVEIKFHPNVEQSLNNIVTNEGYTFYQLNKRMISTNGGNYMGVLYEVDVKGKTKDVTKETNIFLKLTFPEGSVNDVIDINSCFKHEAFIYTELKNIFNGLQETANIPERERLKLVKSYECNVQAVILENLTRRGFKTLNKMEVMPIKFAELAIIELAKFHGLSLVLKYKQRDYFEKKIKTLKFSHDCNESWEKFLKQQFRNNFSKYFESDIQKKINNFRHTMYDKYPKYCKGETKSVKCLCHGDYKINNMLVKEQDEETTEVVMIDFQLTFYGSPVLDILYLLFTGTDRKFRKSHMNNLKNLYHNTLGEFLNYFDLDINNVYPKKVFENDFNESLDFGLMIALYILPLNFTKEEEVPDFHKNKVEDICLKIDEKFKKRITEIVDDYIDWGIL